MTSYIMNASILNENQKNVVKDCLWNANLDFTNREIFEIGFQTLLSFHKVDNMDCTTKGDQTIISIDRVNNPTVLVLNWN